MKINNAHFSQTNFPINHGKDLSSTGFRLPDEFRKPPHPEKSCFCLWLYDFLNYLSGTFGEKLSCSKLNSALNNIFSTNNGWQHKGRFEYGGTIQTGYRSQQIGGVNYIVSAPCHDMTDANPMQDRLSGGRTAAQTLREIKCSYPHEHVKILVPIAQSNKFGLSTRGHFVLLDVDMNAGKIQSVKIHDSKGCLLDTLYQGAAHLTKQLLADENLNLAEDFGITTEYYGHQSLFNGKDCGRYVAYYAHNIISDGDVSQENKANARFFFAKHL